MNSVDVIVTDEYTLGIASVEQILERHPDINAIINSNPYGQYTGDAKQRALSYNVGLFSYDELLGALNYDGTRFTSYYNSATSLSM